MVPITCAGGISRAQQQQQNRTPNDEGFIVKIGICGAGAVAAAAIDEDVIVKIRIVADLTCGGRSAIGSKL